MKSPHEETHSMLLIEPVNHSCRQWTPKEADLVMWDIILGRLDLAKERVSTPHIAVFAITRAMPTRARR
jgi:hypothetical protein